MFVTKYLKAKIGESRTKYPNTVLLFRGTTTYEAYEDDAEVLNKLFGTSVFDKKGIKYSVFPYYKFDEYLPRIINAGYRIAIFDIR